MKRGNIFGIQSNQPGAIQTIVRQVQKVLSDRTVDEQSIQIEIKYAQFKYFSPPRYNQYLSKVPQNQVQKLAPMIQCVELQRYYSKDNLKRMSHQNIIHLNPLERRTYALISCFDEERYQKFYHMKDFLIKQCQFNQNFKKRNILLPEEPKNIYHQYTLIADNQTFEMNAKNQIRLDILIKDQGSQLNGRYSYSTFTNKWLKTKKTQMIKQQIDIMMSQKTFRLAINNEQQTDVSFQELVAIKEQISKKKFRQIDIRLKKTLRCTKGGIVQYSLSEVYQPQKAGVALPNFEDLQQYIVQDSDVLDQYVIQKFQYFYQHKKKEDLVDTTKSQMKYEIECQFTKQGVKNLKKLIQKRQLKEVGYQIEEVISSLYNLFFADHSVRSNEAVWMDKIASSKQKIQTPNGIIYRNQRLVNQFGSYMHNIMYEEMTKLKNN